MSDESSLLKPGDRVAYLLSDGSIASDDRGKVLGIIRTQDGKSLADVEWPRMGFPGRVTTERLVKA